MPRLIGVDAGDERIGLAICDDQGRIAVPFAIIERKGRGLDWSAHAIAEQAREKEAEGLVVGLPLNMDGSFGPQAVKARALGRKAAAAANLPLEFCDERLSSFIAEQRLLTLPSRRGRRTRRSDAVAAAIILQSFLDRSSGEKPDGSRESSSSMCECEPR